MSWQINDDELPPQEYEISQVDLWKIPATEREYDRGTLHPINRAEYKKFKPREFLPEHLIDLHKRLVSKFGVGNIVPFSEIENYFSEIGRFALRAYITRLWVDGYLNKYAHGVYGTNHHNVKWDKKNDWRGRYFGVHYEVVRKEYR